MPLIASIDGTARRVYLSLETVNASINPIDLYKEMRSLRRTDESLRKFEVFMSAFGNVPKGGGKATERYVVLNSGTRIVPYDASHVLDVIGTVITDDEQEGVACFDRALITPSSIVDINYVPPQVEVITISVGSGLTAEQAAQLAAAAAASGSADTKIDSIPANVWNFTQ